MTAMKAEQATGTAPRTSWCQQHHQPRADCLPQDRHVQSFRGADELMDAVKAKAEEMGLNRQDGIEMALEQFVGWHEPGEQWRGPRAVREPRGRWRVPAAAGRSEREVADQILQDRDARIKREAATVTLAAEEWLTIDGRGELAVIAGLPAWGDIYDPRTLKGRRVVIDRAQCDVTGVEVSLGYEPSPSRPYRGPFGLLVKRADQQRQRDRGPAPGAQHHPVTIGNGATVSPEPKAAPGSAVFREPGGKPVIAAAVPQVPASRSKQERRK